MVPSRLSAPCAAGPTTGVSGRDSAPPVVDSLCSRVGAVLRRVLRSELAESVDGHAGPDRAEKGGVQQVRGHVHYRPDGEDDDGRQDRREPLVHHRQEGGQREIEQPSAPPDTSCPLSETWYLYDIILSSITWYSACTGGVIDDVEGERSILERVREIKNKRTSGGRSLAG